MDDINKLYFDELFFDIPVLDELDPDDNHVCPRCNTEFETVEELEYIDRHHVCPCCMSDLTLQAAEESMDI